MFELEHPLSDVDEQKLRLLTCIEKPDEALPDNLLEVYDKVRRTARRLGKGMDDTLLVVAAMLAGQPTPEAPISFLDTALEMSKDERVLAYFRGKYRWGRFQRVQDYDKRIVVILDESPSEERKFKPTSVRRPSSDELRGIGEL